MGGGEVGRKKGGGTPSRSRKSGYDITVDRINYMLLDRFFFHDHHLILAAFQLGDFLPFCQYFLNKVTAKYVF